ncbi:MAG: hypothetical protein GEV04_03885 [Actinophytocola sp.]|nr:hypothetical protein [Actinophytocola sp.]
MRDLITTMVARVATTILAVAAGLVSIGSAAFASTGQVAAESATSFGLLGPVGVVAFGVGVVGMVAGVARRRRQELAHSVAGRKDVADRATAARAERVAEARGAASVPAPSRASSAERTDKAPVESSRAA